MEKQRLQAGFSLVDIFFKETKIKSWLKADNLSPLSHALYTVTRFFEAYPKKEEKGRINCVTFVVNHNNWCWLYNPMSAD